MPQLQSGRHFGLSADGYKKAMTSGSDRQKSAAIMSYRMTVHKPEDLLPLLRVAYFDEEAGTPPGAPTYDSGYSVDNVLAGNSDWSDAEVEEFRQWVDTNPAIAVWLEREFNEIHELIVLNPVWNSPFWMED